MIGAVIFARMASSRLPSKVMTDIQGKPILQHIIERVSGSKYIQKIVLSTSTNSTDDILEKFGRKIGIEVFRGSEDDVLDRCYQTAVKYSLDPIVRVTSDDPCKDPMIIDGVIEAYLNGKYDLVCNTLRPTFPEGLDVEVFAFNALKRAWKESDLASEREHLTLHMLNNREKFNILNIENTEDLSAIRLTLDTKEDLEFIKLIYRALYPKKKDFSWIDVMNYIKINPQLLEINKNVKKSGRYQR